MLKDEAYLKLVTLCINFLTVYPKTQSQTLRKIHDYLKASDFGEFSEEDKESIAESVLENLIKIDIVNDQTYITRYISSNNASSKPDGSYLLVKKLREKGISQDLLDKSFEQIQSFDAINAKKLLLKKYKEEGVDGPQKRVKIAYLSSRGFNIGLLLSGGGND